MCVLFELMFVFIVMKLTNQVPNLWERVKIYFIGIPKSDFTTIFCDKLISSWEVLIVKFVIPNPFPYLFGMYVCKYFPFNYQFIAKGQKH